MKKQNDFKWLLCPKCGHKLFRFVFKGGLILEIKCHSCKTISFFEIKSD